MTLLSIFIWDVFSAVINHLKNRSLSYEIKGFMINNSHKSFNNSNVIPGLEFYGQFLITRNNLNIKEIKGYNKIWNLGSMITSPDN